MKIKIINFNKQKPQLCCGFLLGKERSGMMNLKMIGEKIKNKRIEKDMSLVELGEKIGVGKSVIWKYEHGEIHNIPLERIFAISDVLEIPCVDLLSLKEGKLIDSIVTMNLNEEQLKKLEEYAKFLNYTEETKTPI